MLSEQCLAGCQGEVGEYGYMNYLNLSFNNWSCSLDFIAASTDN